MINQPKLMQVDPRKLIPYHDATPKLHFVAFYRSGLLNKIPPIPIMKAPKDLERLGEYMIYNGHHRTKSALVAGINPNAYLIKTSSDIEFLERHCDTYQELLEGLDTSFNSHFEFVSDMARYYDAIKNNSEDKSKILELSNRIRLRYSF